MTSPSHPSGSRVQAAAAAGWLGSWLSVAALGLWAGFPSAAPLLVAAGGFTASAVWGRAWTRSGAFGALLLLAGILAGFGAQRQVAVIEADFETYWREREVRVGDRLRAELDDRLAAAEEAADALAARAEEALTDDGAIVQELRARYGVSALALYGLDGELRSWDGSHRGKVPEEVQRGMRRYAYGDLPLFGHLYVMAPAGVAGMAVSAILLRADLPGLIGAEAGDLASTFRGRMGEGIRVVRQPSEGEAGWDMVLGEQTLFTVVLDRPVPEARVARILNDWRMGVAALALLAWVFLAVGSAPRVASGSVAALCLLFLAGVLPLQELGVLASLFGSTDAGGSPGVSSGRLAALALAAVTVVAVLPKPRPRFRPVVAGLIAAVVYPLLLLWLGSTPAPGALAAGELRWVVHQAASAVFLTLATCTLLVRASDRPGRRIWAGAGLAVAGLLGAGGAALVWTQAGAPWWWPALWGVPVGLVVASLGGWGGWQRPVANWVLAALLAGSAAIPWAWNLRVEARFFVGGQYLERLAVPEDPELERALYALGRSAEMLAQEGERGVDLLYSAWRASGLAEMGAPAWLTLWSDAGIPEEELRVGVGDRPVVMTEVQADPGPTPGLRILRYDRSDARYVLRVPLSDGEVLTAAAPPFADPAARTPLSPLLGGREVNGQVPLTLIPLPEGDPRQDTPLNWARVRGGWQGELPLNYPNAQFHAHYAVPLPGALLATARGTLLLLLDLVLVLGFWIAGRGLLREVPASEMRWTGLVISFRARVTLALFGFFVLANAIFGTLAYRTIAGASNRTAQVLAERVAEDAAGWYFEVSGRMQALARRVGVELLEYRDGELREGSVEELVELGLYEGWLPMDVQRMLDGREGVREVTDNALGRWRYVTAFRRLPDGDILSAEVPLQAGATAIRAPDVAELLGFAVVLGAMLSLGLALLVGRALTRPIQALQIASERVGAGNFELRLPAERGDEFGAVFRAFNRMVGRLLRARRQLERTSRRAQAIMEEAAVGMVALDSGGRVTLVNPRAEDLLAVEVTVGERVPREGELGEQLAGWLNTFMAADRDEQGAELSAKARRFRVRARRLGTAEDRGGAVVALEDVTDELRTERVLAWGEMARQVAHEVKNPLTPIKLSVQHIRRAWDDGRHDFGDILTRNADAMLKEIDHLAAIAQSFSRFGAPADASQQPVHAVDVGAVVNEVLTLYRSEGPVGFEGEVEASLPAAQARVPELKEVLVNLMENARLALSDGGRVRVTVSSAGSAQIVIRVIDDGSGIPEELMARVFEPHFSTRSQGTGLGLAIVRRLVESWGGTVSLRSSPGEGTTVTLVLVPWQASGGGGGGDREEAGAS